MNALWRKSAMFFRHKAERAQLNVQPRWYSLMAPAGLGVSFLLWIGIFTTFSAPLQDCTTLPFATPPLPTQQLGCLRYLLPHKHAVTDISQHHALVVVAGLCLCSLLYVSLRELFLVRHALVRRCFEQAADGLLVVGVRADGCFICQDANASWRLLPGPLAQVVIGRQPNDIWPTTIADELVQRFQCAVDSGRPVRYETSEGCTSAASIWIVITPVRRSIRGRIIALMCQGRHVTDQLEVKANIHQEQSVELIRLLAAGVAHDFNNILQAVCSGLELILDEATTSDSAREYAVTALTAAQRGGQLTRNLLAYAKHQVLTPGPIDLRQWLPQLSPELEAAIGPNNRLVLIFAGGPAIAFADETSLRNALLYLAVIAGRGMSDGGLIRIETDGHDPGDCTPCVKIKLWDTHAAMDEAHMPRCLDPFLATRSFSGPGVGLSMVHGFATQSGGTLQVANRFGEGTLAILTLPAYVADRAGEQVRDWHLTSEIRCGERKVLAALGVDA